MNDTPDPPSEGLEARSEALGSGLAAPVDVPAVASGWRAVARLVAIGVALVILCSLAFATKLGPAEVLALAAALLLATFAGHGLHHLWHESERRARAEERRSRLLANATIELHAAKDEDGLYAAALRLLSDVLSFGHAEVFVPSDDEATLRLVAGFRAGLPLGFRIPLASVMGRAFRTGEPQYVADTTMDASYVTVSELGAARSELALPVRLGGTVHAVLNVEHADPHAFGPADHRTLAAFSRVIEEVLARLHAVAELRAGQAEKAFVARMTQRLLHAEDATTIALAALEDLSAEFGFGAAAVLTLRNTRLSPLALHGTLSGRQLPGSEAGFPFEGAFLHAWTERASVFVRDGGARSGPLGEGLAPYLRAFAVVPIANANRQVQALLLLGDADRSNAWGPRKRALLELVATSLGVALDRATLQRQLVALLDTVRDLARAEHPEAVVGQAATAAVQLIPGAEAASILVRSDSVFRYAAASGYPLAPLLTLAPFSEADCLAWYGGGLGAYEKGVARVMSGREIAGRSAEAGDIRGPWDGRAGSEQVVRANLCVPVGDHGEVVAILNVDSFSDEEAFGSSSMRLAEAFGQQIAVIVKQAWAIGELRRSAVTDPLTGLGNREGFHRTLEAELEKARRYDRPFSLLLLDLDAFKLVNDELGHHAGDRALEAVAKVLLDEQRSSDSAFRWGGDEFIVLLPESDATAARHLARRLCERIAGLEAGGVPLRASVGISSYPTDGSDRETLMRHADDLMYGNKQNRSPLPPAPPAASEPLA